MTAAATRLSESPLWDRQREFFVSEGAAVSQRGIVPSYISTNPFLGDYLAEILAAYVNEVGGPLDIVELGGGSGKLAFHVLRGLSDRLSPGSCRYVLTDLAPSMVGYWRGHPRLTPFVDGGWLDFAVFDVAHPARIELAISGEVVGGKPGPRAGAAVASYCFDSVPQDLFSVDEAGQLAECLVRVHDDEQWPERAALSFDRKLAGGTYYDDRDLDGILAGYQRAVPGKTFPFPNLAIKCLEFLAAGFTDGFLALTGDRGFTRPEECEVISALEPTRHGSVSLPVNFHAIGEWFKRRGGSAWHPEHVTRSFNVSAFACGCHSLPATETTYRTATATRDPDGFFALKKTVQSRYAELSVPELLAFLRFSHWDAAVFEQMFLHLLNRIAAEPPDQRTREEIVKATGRVEEGYYPVRDDDPMFKLASLLFAIGQYRGALVLFGRSLEGGDSFDAWLNSAICHHMLDDRDQALVCVSKALELEPQLDEALELLQELLEAAQV